MYQWELYRGLFLELWLASIITKNNASMGLLKNIVVGILGAMIGGFVVGFFGGTGVTGFNLWSIFVAFLGAVILLAIINLFTK
ncbi:GlsB/YeaQ/YmgE family stress response membrane protein [Acetobacterium sp.]|uniref:GlsB/YeaQ/YmgE family stress response membrane protein n=1 Tax=Acetobacterium sp. TaxID=1872094 RepID=UPI002F3E81BA